METRKSWWWALLLNQHMIQMTRGKWKFRILFKFSVKFYRILNFILFKEKRKICYFKKVTIHWTINELCDIDLCASCASFHFSPKKMKIESNLNCARKRNAIYQYFIFICHEHIECIHWISQACIEREREVSTSDSKSEGGSEDVKIKWNDALIFLSFCCRSVWVRCAFAQGSWIIIFSLFFFTATTEPLVLLIN